MVWLVAGLGNPGPRYARTRHNVGFLVADELARRAGASWRQRFNARVAEAHLGGQRVVLVEPLTFMNLSGEAIGPVMRWYKATPAEVIVVHDDMDLPFGRIRVRVGGGTAGHNGLKSIVQHIGADFVRVRIGIGRPAHGTATDHVLGRFSDEEEAALDDIVPRAADATEVIVEHGPREAMNRFNGPAAVQGARGIH